MAGLTDERLRGIETGEGLGGERTARARVIVELVSEIRRLRELVSEDQRVR